MLNRMIFSYCTEINYYCHDNLDRQNIRGTEGEKKTVDSLKKKALRLLNTPQTTAFCFETLRARLLLRLAMELHFLGPSYYNVLCTAVHVG